MTRRPLDVFTDALRMCPNAHDLDFLPAECCTRRMLDALTTDPDVRERVAAVIREAPHLDRDTPGEMADAVLAALRDEETRW